FDRGPLAREKRVEAAVVEAHLELGRRLGRLPAHECCGTRQAVALEGEELDGAIAYRARPPLRHASRRVAPCEPLAHRGDVASRVIAGAAREGPIERADRLVAQSLRVARPAVGQ